MINTKKLSKELSLAGIKSCGCNSNGVVWDDDNNEIQDRPDVKAILVKHDPTPEKEEKEPTIKELLQRIDALEKKVK